MDFFWDTADIGSRMAQLLTLCFLATILPVVPVTGWLNDYDQPVNFQCPSDMFLARIRSQHSDVFEDRVWDLGCRNVPIAGAGATNCLWTTHFANDFDGPLTFQCHGDKVMAGMQSFHDNYHEDRVFRFQCCEVPNAVAHGCYYADFENNFDGTLDYTVPQNKILKGVISFHSDFTEDRRFKFEICEIMLNWQ